MRGSSAARSECRNSRPSPSPLETRMSVTRVSLLPHSFRAYVTLSRAFCDLAKETETQWFARSGSARATFQGGCQLATIERMRGRRRKNERWSEKGVGPHGASLTIPSTSMPEQPDFMRSFSQRKKRHLPGAGRRVSKRASSLSVCVSSANMRGC